MPFFTKQQRKRSRAKKMKRRLHQLSCVETFPSKANRGRIISVVMCSKSDPQSGEQLVDGFLDYIKPWWTTVSSIGLQGTILHDGLPDDVVQAATNEHIKFVKIVPGELPILHDRHRVVYEYLQQIDDPYVFVTDISDVAFKRDPFPLIEQDAQKHRLFIGSETKTIGECRSIRGEVTKQFGSLLFADRPVVNPGILGGRREEVIDVLKAVLDCIDQLGSKLVGTDMSIINKVVHEKYSREELFTGFPLHSRFRKWEFGTRAAILHK